MNIIEQATKRLEQLERAGVAVPWSFARGAARAPAPALPIEPAVTPTPAVPAAASSREPAPQATLNLAELGAAGYLVPDQLRSAMAEEFRHLKRPLLKNAARPPGVADHRGALIMVTSAVPGEGKTFCAINLAMSMAMEVDTAVVLVDADVIRPALFARLGVDARRPGLLDLLVHEELALQDTVVATNVPKLSIMASGTRDARSTELLASVAMDRLLARLAKEYADCVVIFDAPPLLLTTEASVLASKVGQVVMVVESAMTPRHVVQQAFALVRHCPIVLTVLNKSDEPGQNQRYGYYR